MSINDQALLKVENAIIMAAGLSSRFAPISYEYPKSLVKVKGQVLIERQIRQLQEAGIEDITIVVGFKKKLFQYLVEEFQVTLVENSDYATRNNHSTLYAVKEKLGNTYICSADNYFTQNVFEPYVENAYYSSVYEEGETGEWCIETDATGLITDLKIGGENSWVMLGHVFFSSVFSKRFVAILESVYDEPETPLLLWESIYLNHIDELTLYSRHYSKEIIFEFDTLDELRKFDSDYIDSTGSKILEAISKQVSCKESDILRITPIKEKDVTTGFKCLIKKENYSYIYETKKLIKDKE
ncbi:CTP:phosphocholine cytidylyltransferase [Carnobacterium iners]|uniref:CTP:phosphocholine cytidylyltransferase n=1 Tax=Carnobacterium iners TaxID=1073423 RepID=A0A1X7N401_9LACT|nr:NTP transferase domain-containing protein [Carnobacterium iners]SEK61459.1 CTP:phosphocholine cytidylyltransferase [Carnobacterium iners]SMH32100.1 CTP:phosphocholine cytidylyltransferase [Carnobacterium iners]